MNKSINARESVDSYFKNRNITKKYAPTIRDMKKNIGSTIKTMFAEKLQQEAERLVDDSK